MFWRWKRFLQRLFNITVDELEGKPLKKRKERKNALQKKAIKKEKS